MGQFFGSSWDELRLCVGSALMKVEDQGRYSDFARELDDDEIDALWESGGSHCATRIDRDDEFIQVLRDMLAELGMEQPPLKTNPKKAPKPRKVRQFKVGDTVRARYVRDLLPGTKLVKGEGQRCYDMKEGKTYTWYGKNKRGAYVIEDPSERKDSYWRYHAVTTREMDGAVVKALPKPVDPEEIDADV